MSDELLRLLDELDKKDGRVAETPKGTEDLLALLNELDKEEPSTWDSFKYGFAKEGNLFTNVADWAEAKVAGLGRIDPFNTMGHGFYASPTEIYGDEWETSNTDERLAMIYKARQDYLDKEYGEDREEVYADQTATTAGGFVKGVADPFNLLPMGRGVATVATTAGAIGATGSVVDDIVKGEEADLGKALIVGSLSALTAGTLEKGIDMYQSSKVGERVLRARKVATKANEILEANPPKSSNPVDIEEALIEGGVKEKDVPLTMQAMEEARMSYKDPAKSNPETELEDLANSHMVTAGNSTTKTGDKTKAGKTVEELFGAVSTTVGKISRPMERRLRKYYHDSGVDYNKSAQTVKPFVEALRDLPEALNRKVGYYLANGDYDSVRALAKAEPKVVKVAEQLPVIQRLLDDKVAEMRDIGREFEELANYYPRTNIDYEGFLTSVGADSNIITREIKKVANRKNKRVEELTDKEKDDIAFYTLRNRPRMVAQDVPSNVKERKVAVLTEEQYNRFYDKPEDALMGYLSRVSHDVHMAKLFGTNYEADDTIASMVGRMVEEDNISNTDIRTLVDTFESLFVNARKPAKDVTKVIRDLGYIGTIGNLGSAIIQVADIGLAGIMHGGVNSVRSLARSVTGKSKVTIDELGLPEEGFVEMMSGGSATSRALNKVLSATGFKTVDRLGKETLINSALTKLQKQAIKKPNDIRKKWGDYYGKDMDILIEDLKAGRNTDLVKEHAFVELSRIQPINMFEMPKAYADNPNGRILYMLKSFTLKQWDLLRREVVHEYKKGNKAQALKTAGALAGYLTLSGVGFGYVRDWVSGKDPDIRPEELPEKAFWNLLGVYGLSEFAVQKGLREKSLGEIGLTTILPPTTLIDAPLQLTNLIDDNEDNDARAMKALPVVGNVAYNWLGGGMEEHQKRRAQERGETTKGRRPSRPKSARPSRPQR